MGNTDRTYSSLGLTCQMAGQDEIRLPSGHRSLDAVVFVSWGRALGLLRSLGLQSFIRIVLDLALSITIDDYHFQQLDL
jgi:hypothetical protein